MKYVTVINGKQFEIEIKGDGSLLVNGTPHEVDFLPLSAALYSIIKDYKSFELAIEESNNTYQVLMNGRLYDGQVLDERALLLMNRKGGLGLDVGELHSPMPGLIVEVRVAVGDHVQRGQTLVILESMKMQNELKAQRDGVVTTVNVHKGQTVDKNDVLVIVHDAENPSSG